MMASEKPSDAIIENDARFDKWLEDYTKKMARAGKASADDRWKAASKFQG